MIQSLIIISCITFVYAQPGLVGLISSAASTQIQNNLIPVVTGIINSYEVSDYSGEAQGYQYNISNIQVISFDLGGYSVTPNPGANCFDIEIGDISGSVGFDWEISGGGGNGNGVANIVIGFSTYLQLIDANGALSGQFFQTFAIIGGCDISLNGGNSWVYSMLIGILTPEIKQSLAAFIENEFDGGAINNMIAGYAAEEVLTYQLSNGLTLNYGLIQNPSIQNNNTETYHAASWSFNNQSDCNYTPETMPSYSNNDGTLNFLLSETVFTCMTDVLWQANYLMTTVTPEEIPAASPLQLNTDNIIMKQLIPELDSSYPSTPMELGLYVMAPPQFYINSGSVTFEIVVDVNVTVQPDSETTIAAFNMEVQCAIAIIPSIDNVNSSLTLITAQASNATSNVTLLWSNIGDLDLVKLNKLVDFLVQFGVIPAINSMGGEGIPLPSSSLFQFVTPALVLEEGYLRVVTDFNVNFNNENIRFESPDPFAVKIID